MKSGESPPEMKLLFLTPQLPYPPRQGTTLRNYHLIRRLAKTHTIHLFSFLAPGESLRADSPLHHLCQRIEMLPQPVRSLQRRALDALTSPLPDMALRLATPEAQATIQRMVDEEDYTIVQAEGIEMASYAMSLRQDNAAQALPTFVFDDHNAEYLLQQRAAFVDLLRPQRWVAALYSLIQWQKLRRYERTICRSADAVLVVSEPDRQALQRLAADVDPIVISNGMELPTHQPAQPQTVDIPSLVFTGKMDYRPNVDAVLWFAQKVLPQIQAQVPQVQFQIVGMNPHPRLEELRANPAITITGAVDDIRPYIEAAAVYVVPMRVGGGTRFKVLEAMAYGKAMVSTSLGIEGIPVENHRELLIADRPEAFAASVLELLQDQRQSGRQTHQLGMAAQKFVAEHYTWEKIVPRLEQVYRQLRHQEAL
jgi:polysaccharide biosynthesis protein PslH